MIQLTELAAAALHETLDAVPASPTQGLRLKKSGNRMILKLDSPGKYDQVIWHQNRLVMIVDLETRKEIGDAVVDIEAGLEDPYLILRKWNRVLLN